MRNLLFVILLFVIGCSSASRTVGSNNKWHDVRASFKVGASTEADILELLGPPALIDLRSMRNKTIYYYWLEKSETSNTNLIFFYTTDEVVKYDRAMFIFNEEEVLEKYGISEAIK